MFFCRFGFFTFFPHSFVTMPKRRRRTRKRNVKKRMPKRRKRRGSRKARLMRMGRSIIPTRKFAKLVYKETVEINPGAGLASFASYAMNGIYDPRIAVGGHQPMGHDLLSSMYLRYRVTHSLMIVTHLQLAINIPCAMGIQRVLNAGSQGASTSVQENMERQRSTYRLLSRNSEATMRKVSLFTDCRKEFDSEDYLKSWTPFGSNPSTPAAVYDFWFGAVDGVNDPLSTQFQVTLYYWVECKDPKLQFTN